TGSSSVGAASSSAALKPKEPASLNAISFESTLWYLPSMKRTRASTTGNRATDDLFHELDSASSGQRLHRQITDAVHALAPGLLLQLALDVLGLLLDCLAVGNLGGLQLDLDAEHALQLRDRDAHVQLPPAREQELPGHRVAAEMERGILLHESAER